MLVTWEKVNKDQHFRHLLNEVNKRFDRHAYITSILIELWIYEFW